MKFIVFDIENLPNIHTFCFLDFETGKKKEFVLFDDLEQLHELLKFLKSVKHHKYYLVGFNSIGYDCQIIEYILNSYDYWMATNYQIGEIVEDIYRYKESFINVTDEERFKVLIPEWKFAIPTIDLYKQCHYDRPQKATSLKWLQFTMRYPTVEEMPIAHDSFVQKEDIPNILSYNWNDVDATAEFFKRKKYETELRETLSNKYSLKLLNASEPKMVREIFGKLLCEEMKISYKELKEMRTFRKNIDVNRLIFPYIKFETDECIQILNWFKSLNVNPNVDNKGIQKEFTFNECKCVVALGGIHGCIESGIYTANENNIIKDIDVVSFYPNLAIQNNIKPYHLGNSFNKIYNDIFQQRLLIPKKDPMNYIFKIVLNSAYGLSKEMNGYLYDPLFTYSITVNGQLTLLMLAEQLKKQIPNIIFYQMNTDGVTVGYEPQYAVKVQQIFEWFTEVTKLNLEFAEYQKMIIGDVNSYTAVYTDGKRKKKGRFETEMEYHKNPSFLIVPKALEAYFVEGKDYKEFILNHEDIYDFLGATKKKRDFKLQLYHYKDGEIIKTEQQKVTRYYVSTYSEQSGVLYKDFHSGKAVGSNVAVIADYHITPLNVVVDTNAKNYNINYKYYFNEVEKEIQQIESKKIGKKLISKQQLTLF
jgi:hypothetical protein